MSHKLNPKPRTKIKSASTTQVNVRKSSENRIPPATGSSLSTVSYTAKLPVEPVTPPEKADTESGPAVNESSLDKTNKRLYAFGISGVICIIIIISFIGYLVWYKAPNHSISAPVSENPTPQPTAKPVFNRSNITLEVLNGSGIKGAASRAADKLREKGFPLIVTGNAPKSDYRGNHLYISADYLFQDELYSEIKTLFALEDKEILTGSTFSASLIIGR